MNQNQIRRRYAALMEMLEGDRRDYAAMLHLALVHRAAEARRARRNALDAAGKRRRRRILQSKKRLTAGIPGRTVPV